MSITIPNPPELPDTPGNVSASLEANRIVTRAFIAQLPLTVVLTPYSRTSLPAGGFRMAPGDPREPQVMTLIEPGGDQRPTITQDGVERVIEFELLGEWDAAVARHDTFVHQGKDFEVVEVFYENGYERRALVSGRG